jgi:hypothetical protein
MLMAWLMAAAVPAMAGGLGRAVLPILTATNGGDLAVCTNETIRGEIDEILIDFPSGGGTGVVVVAAVQEFTGASVVLATNGACTSDLTFRTSLDRTDNGGTGLTNDPPSKFVAVGERFEFRLSGYFVTNKTWRAVVKYRAD